MGPGRNRPVQVLPLTLTEPGQAALPTLPLMQTLGVFFPMLHPLSLQVPAQTSSEEPFSKQQSSRAVLLSLLFNLFATMLFHIQPEMPSLMSFFSIHKGV